MAEDDDGFPPSDAAAVDLMSAGDPVLLSDAAKCFRAIHGDRSG